MGSGQRGAGQGYRRAVEERELGAQLQRRELRNTVLPREHRLSSAKRTPAGKRSDEDEAEQKVRPTNRINDEVVVVRAVCRQPRL